MNITMKKKITLLLAMLLMLGTGSVWAEQIEPAGDGYYHITDKSTWSKFARTVNGTGGYTQNVALNAMLDADITIENDGDFNAGFIVGNGSTPSGGVAAIYTGTFDGQGHTLTFTKTLNQEFLAPFGKVSGATIKNLKVAGTLTGEASNARIAVVAYVEHTAGKTTTVEYVSSAMNITTTNESFDGTIGGIVGLVNYDANLVVQGCMYTGTVTSVKSTSGILGYSRSNNVTIKNNLAKCTFTLSNTSAGSNRYIYRGANESSITNSGNFYEITNTNSVPVSGNGTAAQTAQYKSGEMAWYLSGADNSSSSTYFWGQGNLNKSTAETFPVLTNVTDKKVYRIMVNGVSNYPYGNRSGAVPNPVRYGYTAFSTESTVASRTTPLTEISSSYNTAGLYGISNIYTLTVGESLASTLVLPFEAVIPENITAYTLTYTSGDATTATPITTGTIPANTPVLINATAAGNYDFKKKTNSDWAPDATAITWSGATVNNGALTGVYVQNDKNGLYNPTYYVPADSYVLQNGSSGLGFYKVPADNTIKITSFRAYLTAQSAQASRLSINFEDENTTAISSVEQNGKEDNAIYTLTGIKVEQPTSGIYIKNGKKYYVK